MITLTRKDTQDSIALPDRLRWLDEYDWAKIAQTAPEYTLSGAIITEQGSKLAGRPITLGNTDNHNWVKKQAVELLRSWLDIPELEMTLNYHGREFVVCWRTHEKAIDVSPVLWCHDEDGEAWYRIQLRLMTI